jgi:ATP-binding cassette, subfamily B, bacterial MsbA
MFDKLKLLALKNLFIKNYVRMWAFFRPYRVQAITGVFLIFLVGLSDSMIPLFLGIFMDNINPNASHQIISGGFSIRGLLDQFGISRSRDFAMLVPYMVVAFAVIVGMLTYFANCINMWVGDRVTMDIKKRLYQKLLTMSASYFDNNTSGNILFRYNTDAESASIGLIEHLKMFVQRFAVSIGLIYVLFVKSWRLAIIATFVLLVVFAPIAMVRKRMRYIMERATASMTAVITAYNETFAGHKTIAAYNLQGYQNGKFADMVEGVFKFAVKMVRNTNWLSPAMHVIASIGIALVIGFGGMMIVHNQISVGDFTAFVTSLILLYSPLKGIGNNFVFLQMSFMSIERLYEILETTPGIVDAPNAKKLERIRERIEFKDVNFGYLPHIPVLKNINLRIHVGEMVALVGNSGGGKTTIMNLLPRFYEVNSGSISIDGTDIRQFTQQSLRQQIGVVFQDNFLFSGTIRENVLLGNATADETAIYRALELAHLSEFIAELPQGIDTQIGERGIRLSGGQKQRVAIARAFLRDAPILILDEATSALDNKSEAIVQVAINDLMKGRTVFVIAHRLSTVQSADRIVVIDHGKIVEEGNHRELLDRNGAYSSLYQAQFKEQPQAVS